MGEAGSPTPSTESIVEKGIIQAQVLPEILGSKPGAWKPEQYSKETQNRFGHLFSASELKAQESGTENRDLVHRRKEE